MSFVLACTETEIVSEKVTDIYDADCSCVLLSMVGCTFFLTRNQDVEQIFFDNSALDTAYTARCSQLFDLH